MLNASQLVGFVGTTKPIEAKQFYEQTLGLRLVEESPFALVFATGSNTTNSGNTIRVQKVQSVVTPPYTSLGWEVKDIASVVAHLASKGVKFQRYEGMNQSESGIWSTPSGAQVAWFKDPDGNTLSLTEHSAG